MAAAGTRARALARFGAVCLIAAPVAVLGIATTWVVVLHVILRLFDGNGAIQRGLDRNGLDGLGSVFMTTGLVSLVVFGAGLAVAWARLRRHR